MKSDIFFRARLKLTAYYSVGIVLILILFSLGVYLVFEEDLAGEIEFGDHESQFEEEFRQEVADDASRRLLMVLVLADATAAVLATGFSWLLAGRTLAPIKSSLERQKQFVSDAAHELRTPLAVMKAGLETIGAGNEPEIDEYRTLNEDLLEETERVIGLSNDLLFLSRSDQAALPVEMSDIDISVLCSRQVAVMQPYARQRQVELDVDVQPGLRIQGDSSQISRLIQNLLKNSVDHNRDGGRSVLTLLRTGGSVTLVVSDNGPGMGREELRQAFDRFYKSDKARQVADAGAGLGLSIVREIVRLHSGEITIESAVGKGTKVTVVFDLL